MWVSGHKVCDRGGVIEPTGLTSGGVGRRLPEAGTFGLRPISGRKPPRVVCLGEKELKTLDDLEGKSTFKGYKNMWVSDISVEISSNYFVYDFGGRIHKCTLWNVPSRLERIFFRFQEGFKLAKTISSHPKQGFPSTDFSNLACHAAMLL